MNNQIRKLFEEKVYPNFFSTGHGLRRKPNGEYVSDSLEDHWQTFQEGWDLAIVYYIDYLKNKTNSNYSDVVSDGGMDLR
jgi:hypothetical protein